MYLIIAASTYILLVAIELTKHSRLPAIYSSMRNPIHRGHDNIMLACLTVFVCCRHWFVHTVSIAAMSAAAAPYNFFKFRPARQRTYDVRTVDCPSCVPAIYCTLIKTMYRGIIMYRNTLSAPPFLFSLCAPFSLLLLLSLVVLRHQRRRHFFSPHKFWQSKCVVK